MNTLEKTIAVGALLVLIALPVLLIIIPKLHALPILLPLSIFAFIANAALLFVVFKDVFARPFASPAKRYLWVLLIFFFPPAILVYLPLHGFRTR